MPGVVPSRALAAAYAVEGAWRPAAAAVHTEPTQSGSRAARRW